MSLPPGTTLGPYEILATIGAGGIGIRNLDPRDTLALPVTAVGDVIIDPFVLDPSQITGLRCARRNYETPC